MSETQLFYKHDKALIESNDIGRGTRIWAFAHVLAGAIVGEDCNICDHTFIESNVMLGDRVTVKCGVQLWDGVRVESDVFIGPNVTFTNDPFPRSRIRPEAYVSTLVRQGASIGANATILPGIIIGEKAMVGAGSVVTRNVPPLAIVAGNPARIIGYQGTRTDELTEVTVPTGAGLKSSRVAGVTLHRLPSASDMRGQLSFGEIEQEVPFAVKRYFLVYGVASQEVRGEHAHRTLHQFMICVHGSCRVVTDDGRSREEFLLDDPTVGLHVGPMVWATQYKHSEDAVLLVFASEKYDPADYIRDYSGFLVERSKVGE